MIRRCARCFNLFNVIYTSGRYLCDSCFGRECPQEKMVIHIRCLHCNRTYYTDSADAGPICSYCLVGIEQRREALINGKINSEEKNNMALFQYAVIYTPVRTKTEIEANVPAKPELVIDWRSALAKDEATVKLVAARQPELDKFKDEDFDQIEIKVRP